jgi:beta-hydroxylase
MFSAVPHRPVLQQDLVPELAELRDNWQMIREEAQSLVELAAIKAADKAIGASTRFSAPDGSAFYLKWYDEALPLAVANCPNTVALLSSIPTIKGAMFTNLPPGWQAGAAP